MRGKTSWAVDWFEMGRSALRVGEQGSRESPQQWYGGSGGDLSSGWGWGGRVEGSVFGFEKEILETERV